jgi:hypothetical protein
LRRIHNASSSRLYIFRYSRFGLEEALQVRARKEVNPMRKLLLGITGVVLLVLLLAVVGRVALVSGE